MIRLLKFTVPGEPRGKGRPRFTKSGHAYSDEETENYENLVKSEFVRNFPGWIPTDQCLGIYISAFCPAPKNTPKKMMHYVENETRRRPKKPDFDNIDKIICDALNEIAWKDDNQITDHTFRKRYSLRPRVEVTIELLDEIADE